MGRADPLAGDGRGIQYRSLCFQQYVEPTVYQGRYPVIGSWIVGGEPAGIGIRENRSEVTDNLSEFVPHIIVS